MRRFQYALVTSVAAIGFASVGFAAEMAVKVPPPSAVQAGDRWSGFYFGLNGGYGDPNGIDLSSSDSGTDNGLAGANLRASRTGAIPTSLKTDPNGFIGGGQLGYNWRIAPKWLFGLETDVDYANVRGSDNRLGTAVAGPPGTVVTSTATASGEQDMKWFGTLRARLGLLATENLFMYGTGGLAYGNVSASTNVSETDCHPACTTITSAGAASSTRAGWTAGGGLEWAIDRNWSVKTEYLYVHLGDLTYNNSPLTSGAGVSIVNTTSVAHFNSSIVRAGLNYRYDSSGQLASAPPSAVQAGDRWSGFYFGLNGGYGDPNGIDLSSSDSGTDNGLAGANLRASRTGAIPTSLKTDPNGFIGGGQLGYNWRIAPKWLFGLETDVDYANVRGSDNRLGTAVAGPPGTVVTSTATASGEQDMKWFGTLRARLGLLATENLFMYGTGGLAYGNVSASTNVSETDCHPACTTITSAGAASSTRAGWTAGGGLEWAIDRNWSVKTEYLYVHLGDLTYNNSPLTSGAGVSIVNTTSVAHFNSSIVRAGLNYRF